MHLLVLATVPNCSMRGYGLFLKKRGFSMLILNNFNVMTTRIYAGNFVAIVNLKHRSGILCIMYAWLTPDESAAAQNTKIARSLLPHLSLSHPFSCYFALDDGALTHYFEVRMS